MSRRTLTLEGGCAVPGEDERPNGKLTIDIDGLQIEADDHALPVKRMFVYDALYAWCRLQPDQ